MESYRGIASLLGVTGKVSGRKKLQKLVYLAKEMGFPYLEQPFDYYLYGPYSESLANQIQELVVLGGVVEERSSTMHGHKTFAYSLTSIAHRYFREDIESVEHLRPGIELLMDRDARFLELVATLRFLLKSGLDQEEAVIEVRTRKQDQAYREDECREALAFLDQLSAAFQG